MDSLLLLRTWVINFALFKYENIRLVTVDSNVNPKYRGSLWVEIAPSSQRSIMVLLRILWGAVRSLLMVALFFGVNAYKSVLWFVFSGNKWADLQQGEIWARLASSSWGTIRILKSMHQSICTQVVSFMYVPGTVYLTDISKLFKFPAKLYRYILEFYENMLI